MYGKSKIFLTAILLLWFTAEAGCGSEPVERTAGVISGHLPYRGEWPRVGYIILALFRTAPWDPAFVPGAPAAFRYLQQAPSPLKFSFDSPPVAFGSYGALVAAWKDPDDPDASTCMHPVSIYGTDLAHPEGALPIVLGPEHPDAENLQLPEMLLFPTAEEMRDHYPSL